LLEERERACDEHVLRLGSEPKVYAEAILNVCRHYLESPLVILNNRFRFEETNRIDHGPARRSEPEPQQETAASVGGIAAVTALTAIGLLNAPASHAQTTVARPQFELASIKPSKSSDRRPLLMVGRDGGLTVANFTAKMLIWTAYSVKPFQISRGPDWMDSDLSTSTPSRDEIRTPARSH